MVCWSREEPVESNVASLCNVTSSNMEMEEEWDAEAICVIEEDKLELMAMMEEYIDYEND